MGRPNLIFATLTVVALGVLALFGATLLPSKQAADTGARVAAPTPLAEPTYDFADPVRGSLDAPVTITVFSDYLCAPCADVAASIKAVVEANPGKVRVVWKDLPNESYHPGATKLAVGARCAGDQGAFWPFHDLLMERQAGMTEATLVPMAAELGLDIDQFQTCLNNLTTKPLVARTVEEAARLRLDATPYLFIGGRRISGALTQEQLQGFVDAALTAAAPKDEASAPLP
jgi:protein-disulfide isomerase